MSTCNFLSGSTGGARLLTLNHLPGKRMQDARGEAKKSIDTCERALTLPRWIFCEKPVLIKMHDCSRANLWTNDRQYLKIWIFRIIQSSVSTVTTCIILRRAKWFPEKYNAIRYSSHFTLRSHFRVHDERWMKKACIKDKHKYSARE